MCTYTHIDNRILCDDALLESVRHLTILCQIMQNYDIKLGTKNGGHDDAVDAFRIFTAFLEFTHQFLKSKFCFLLSNEQLYDR